MHAKALEIAWHDDSPIWSVDISCANRVVTASGDKVARIWQFHPNPHEALASFAASSISNNCTTGDGMQQPNIPCGNVELSKPTAGKHSAKPSRLSSIKLDASLVEWLCDLRAHATTINIARFSPDGLSVATAADLGEIVVWRLNSSPVEISPLSAADDDAPRERWQIHVTLRGHLQDVLDLAWSADSSKLISGSVDNSVMIWDLQNPTRTPIALRNHSNFVQGVAIDPLSRLVASMGNDRALRVFTATSSSWCQVASVCSLCSDSRLFVDDSRFNNFFRRLSWSPDGSVLACPSGIHLPKEPKKRLYAVHIFARNQWAMPALQCGGLPTPACAVRFSPVLYRLRSPSKVSSPSDQPGSPTTVAPSALQNPFHAFSYRMVFAVACAHSILFYDTEHLTRPFAAVEGLHCAEHTDISWSGDGRTLLVSAIDGYVSIICFSEEEMGQPLSPAETPPWFIRNEEVVVKTSGSTPTVTNPAHYVSATVVQSRPVEGSSKVPESLRNISAASTSTRDSQIQPESIRDKTLKTQAQLDQNQLSTKGQNPSGDLNTTNTEGQLKPVNTNLISNSKDFVPPLPSTSMDVGKKGSDVLDKSQHTSSAVQLLEHTPQEKSGALHEKPVDSSDKQGTADNNTSGKSPSLGGPSNPAHQSVECEISMDLVNLDGMDTSGPSSPGSQEVVFVSAARGVKVARTDCETALVETGVEPSSAKKPKTAHSTTPKRRGKSNKVQTKFCFFSPSSGATPVVSLAVPPETVGKTTEPSNVSSEETGEKGHVVHEVDSSGKE